MARLPRVIQKLFGSNGPAGEFGKFGSRKNLPIVFTQDPATIQELTAFLNGLGDCTVGNQEPPMEDLNSLWLLVFRQIAYLFQEGIPEWESNTIYFTGSYVKVGSTIYRSVADNNSGVNPATDNGSSWQQGFGGPNGGVPTGTILEWGGDPTDIPSGYLYGDGQAVSRTTYAALFAKYGTKYGAGNGTTTFNLPNGKGRFRIGVDGSAEFLNVGQIGGVKVINLSHQHTGVTGNGIPPVSGSGLGQGGESTHRHSFTTDAAGDTAQSILNPYLVTGGIIVKT